MNAGGRQAPRRPALEALEGVVSYLPLSSPLALVAASPLCRVACERRGVEAAADAGASAAELDDRDDIVEARLLARQRRIAGGRLLQPVLDPSTIRELQHTRAGVRVGRSVSFLVPAAPGVAGAAGGADSGLAAWRRAAWGRGAAPRSAVGLSDAFVRVVVLLGDRLPLLPAPTAAGASACGATASLPLEEAMAGLELLPESWEEEAMAAEQEGAQLAATAPVVRVAVTADSPPPSAWWFNRPLLLLQAPTAAGVLPGLWLHVSLGYPRWLAWAAAALRPSLLAVSCRSWVHGEEGLGPPPTAAASASFLENATEEEEGEGLPLRAFFCESATSALVRAAAADGAVEVLELPYFTDRRLGDAALFRRLRRLSARQGAIDDAAMAEAFPAPWPRGLTAVSGALMVEVDLSGCGAIASLEFCLCMPRLRALAVSRTRVGDDALHTLELLGGDAAVCGELLSLDVDRCPVNGGLAAVVRCFPRLRLLSAQGCPITDDGLAAFATAAAAAAPRWPLTTAALDGCSQLASLAPLWRLPDLRSVSAGGCCHLVAAVDEGLQPPVPPHCAVETLILARSSLLDAAAMGWLPAAVGEWTLRTLILDGTTADDSTICLLGGQPAGGSPADAPEAPPPPLCRALETVSLARCMRVSSLGPLGDLPSLRTLRAPQSGVTDAGLADLAGSATLRSLDLSGTAVDNIAPLARLRALRSLTLARAARLSDQSLLRFVFAAPRPAPALERLDLSGCALIRQVGCLGHLPALQSLGLSGTAVFDTSFFGFYASRRALLMWRPAGAGDGASELPLGRRRADAPNAPHFVDAAAEEEGEREGAPLGRPSRIPDLSELQARLAREPSESLLFSAAAHITDMRLARCSGVRSIEPLGLLPRLRSLCLEATAVDSAALRGFAVLHATTRAVGGAGEGLRYLNVAGCEYITDVGSLAAIATLRTLDASGSAVTDAGLAALTEGCGSYLAAYTGATAARGMAPALRLQLPTAVRTLRLAGCRDICDVRCLLDMASLREVNLSAMLHTVEGDVVEALRDRGVRVYI